MTESVRASHILVKTKEEAENLKSEIEGGKVLPMSRRNIRCVLRARPAAIWVLSAEA